MRTSTKRKKTRTTTRTRIGASFASLLMVAAAMLGPVLRGEEKKTSNYSVVAGTVFREPGFALPEAEVVLTPEPGQVALSKVKKMTFSTNNRGEFAFRVPAAAGRYTVAVRAKGYIHQQKTVDVTASDRSEVTFTLAAESNK